MIILLRIYTSYFVHYLLENILRDTFDSNYHYHYMIDKFIAPLDMFNNNKYTIVIRIVFLMRRF